MRKKSEKCRRRLMVLLAAVCMFSAIPYAPVTASERTVSIESEDKEIQEPADTEKTENATEDSGQTEDTKEPDESETDGSEQTEEQEKESTGTEESENPNEKDQTEETEDSNEENPEDSEEEDSETGEGEESAKDGEESEEEEQPEETEAEEMEDEENPDEEDSEESLMLFADEAEGDAVTDGSYTDENGVVYHYYGYEDGTANIYGLESYITTYPNGKVINIPAYIDGYTVTQLTFIMSDTIRFPSITVPETVTYIGNYAFRFAQIGDLYYNAVSAQTEAKEDKGGSFARAVIKDLHIGEDVRVIPDSLFIDAEITMDELVLDVESIGEYAFYAHTTVTDLVIGENVKEIGMNAFGYDKITNVYYNAVSATHKNDTVIGPFSLDTLSGITFGDKVEVIPDYLFHNVKYTADTLVFPDSLREIGANAFNGFGFNIEELTIGENVTSIGLMAFNGSTIGILNYNAVETEIPGITASLKHRNPFDSVKVGELRFGDKVKVLPDYLFYCVRLDQEELVIPDSVTHIGAQVLSCSYDSSTTSKMFIGTLVIGENVTHMGAWSFGKGIYDKVIVYATQSDCAVMPFNYEPYLPVCGSVEIHGNAAGYQYFTAKTEEENITLMCEDFETTCDEENYDEKENTCVTVITDTCVVCGYEIVNEEKVDAYTVLFKQPGGGLISSQHVHSGKDAVEPKAPERTGYEFAGWDKDFTNVTSNITVTAQYNVKTFSVVFKDGEDIISEQEIEYGSDAKLPENPTRPEEEWGTWKFTGWDGNYKNVIQDEVIQAQFEKVINKYEVVFHDAEGNVISRQTVAHGESAEVPEAPEKKSTAQYTYTFTGWNGDTDNVTGNTDFYPVYEAATRSYTVTFVNGEEVLSTQSVEYGKDAAAPENPERAEEEWGTWKFTGWDSDYTNIAKDMIIRAQFEQIFHEYEVIFYDEDGNILSRQTVAHGHAAKAPEAPEKESTEEFCYPFTGWSGDITNITADAVFYPTYGMETRTYMVTFMNGNTVFNRQTVKYGKSAITPIEPKKEADAKYTYSFIGWDSDYSVITSDTVIHALYEQKEIPANDKPGKEDDTGKKDDESDGGGNDDDDGGNGGDDEAGPAPDGGGENPEPETEEENVENPDNGLDKIIEKQVYNAEIPGETLLEKLPQITEAEADEFAEIVTEEPLTEDTDNAESAQETAEAPAEDNTDMSVLGWFILLVGIILLAFLLFWILFLYFAKRKVCGTILYESGGVPCGVQVTLSGKDIMETELDEDGFFSFDGLKKDDYELNVYDGDGYKIFSADIRMESGSGEDVFIILESDCSNAETSEKRGIYKVNLTV